MDHLKRPHLRRRQALRNPIWFVADAAERIEHVLGLSSGVASLFTFNVVVITSSMLVALDASQETGRPQLRDLHPRAKRLLVACSLCMEPLAVLLTGGLQRTCYFASELRREQASSTPSAMRQQYAVCARAWDVVTPTHVRVCVGMPYIGEPAARNYARRNLLPDAAVRVINFIELH